MEREGFTNFRLNLRNKYLELTDGCSLYGYELERCN